MVVVIKNGIKINGVAHYCFFSFSLFFGSVCRSKLPKSRFEGNPCRCRARCILYGCTSGLQLGSDLARQPSLHPTPPRSVSEVSLRERAVVRDNRNTASRVSFWPWGGFGGGGRTYAELDLLLVGRKLSEGNVAALSLVRSLGCLDHV